MKNNWIKELILILLTITPTTYLFFIWQKLPLQIATHFDLEGNANGFTSKSNMIWILSAIMIGIYLLLQFLPKLDPKNQIEYMGKKYFQLKLLLMSLMSGMFTYIIYMAANKDANSSFIFIFLAVFFIIMGNLMQTIKPNYFIGMRTPWTLQSETVWRKTHKLSGILMIFTGFILIIAFFLISGKMRNLVFMPLMIFSILIPYLYSYVLYKKEVK